MLEVRSYKRRGGRLGPESAGALQRLLDHGELTGWPRAGRPLVVEVGFGMGEATALCAQADPGVDVLAVEVHRPGIAALLRLVEQRGLRNVRVVEGDAMDVLQALPARSVAEVRLWFPDPWPKTRHAKRRFVRASTAELIASRLLPTGRLHLATDSRDLLGHCLPVLAPRFEVQVVDRPRWRPVTGFEARALAAGRRSYDVLALPAADHRPDPLPASADPCQDVQP